MTESERWWTPSGVRMTRCQQRDGDLNWLFLPGGPGLGSESVRGLVDAVQVPGTSWLVDLPGDGSNVDPPGAGPDPYRDWPHVLVEAARCVANPIYVGHSTGGMYLLSVPELEELLTGLALVSSAPDASWRPAFVTMTEQRPIAAVAEAAARYRADPGNDTLRELCLASAGWNFVENYVHVGAAMLAELPYNDRAVAWSAQNFNDGYLAAWWPRRLPALIVSGRADRVVAQSVWDAPRFSGDNVLHRTIAGAAHFPWIERPAAVRAAFAELSDLATARQT